jgi:putative serine protease PepD
VIGAAVILAAGVGFGAGRAMGLGDTVALSGILRPATTATPFVEDDDGIDQDRQENILDSTALGMVHVLSGGTSVGIGLVLTESGKVLTTYQPSAGAVNLAAEYVLSRQTFKAKVIGTDPAASLALLQLEGPKARAFSTVPVGN